MPEALGDTRVWASCRSLGQARRADHDSSPPLLRLLAAVIERGDDEVIGTQGAAVKHVAHRWAVLILS